MNKNLLKQKCMPCELGGEPMQETEINMYMADLSSWTLSEDKKKIKKEYKFADFLGAINFVNHIAEIAEEEGHHPDIYIFYNKVHIELWTHAVGGLSLNDFILANKIDASL